MEVIMKDLRIITRAAMTIMVSCALFACSDQAEIVQKSFGQSPWNTFEGDVRIYPAFPDHCSRYDNFVFRQHSGDFDILKVTGQFPHARYFSFNLYDFFEATDIASLADIEIEPDVNHINPFDPDECRGAEDRSYTLYVVKEGVTVPPDARNVMVLPADAEILKLVTRVYRPDQGYDSLGGVALPLIEALKADLSSGEIPEFGMDLEAILPMLPKFLFNDELIETWGVVRQFVGDSVTFYRTSDAGLFPNAHNEYIIAPLPQDYINKVAVVTFTSPTVEDTYEGGVFTGDTEVRYWSFCTGGLGLTATVDCLCDDEVKRNPDGTATIIIAPLYLKGAIEREGFNFMRWGAVYKPLLLHRHMLAAEDFEGRIGNVPALDRPPAPENRCQAYFDENAAQNFMGEHAPTGKVYDIISFLCWLLNQ